MHISRFIELLERPEAQNRVFFLASKTKQYHFLACLHKVLAKQAQHINTLSCSDVGPKELMLNLSTSFLGQEQVWIITDIDELSPKDCKACTAFLEEYTGPHTILCMLAEAPKKCTQTTITLEPISDIATCLSFFEFFTQAMPAAQKQQFSLFFQQALSKQKNLCADQIYLLSTYALVLGKNSPQFFETWFDHIFQQKSSLFTLSAFLFEKNALAFADMWQDIKREYEPVFWTVFLLDVLWQAYLFLYDKKTGLSKEMRFNRLPFSFTRTDWRKHKIEHIKKLYQDIYQFDCDYKRGLTHDLKLEYLLIQFVQK
ncbi:MAG: hypothetical protein UU47_C0005G0020 [candidate division TM6 bacterium GW2011_GWE2_41_16]|nr:MAG: hypothetical protein UU47_C0005G0020 [candidate division TM6 bacterium GW2011_GWE2_41_16]